MAQQEGISAFLDEVACEAIGASLDLLAEGGELHPTAYYAKRGGQIEQAVFEDDDPDACLKAAKRQIRHLGGKADVYALAYDGFIQTEKGAPAEDAVIVEMGERGSKKAYSAAVAYRRDKNGSFSYADPVPAGEEELLL